ncbi:MAG: hypothetical protein H6556_01775 [Lewinellaceae bacterium]|nr:hypothetical protein [Lewinellaceae bacterium]
MVLGTNDYSFVLCSTTPLDSFEKDGLESQKGFLRACLEAGFESEKSQFFDETRRLFEERTLRYGQEKQRSVIKKVAFAAQRLASKHALSHSDYQRFKAY